MIINSENATKIDSYLKDNDEAELGKWPIEYLTANNPTKCQMSVKYSENGALTLSNSVS